MCRPPLQGEVKLSAKDQSNELPDGDAKQANRRAHLSLRLWHLAFSRSKRAKGDVQPRQGALSRLVRLLGMRENKAVFLLRRQRNTTQQLVSLSAQMVRVGHAVPGVAPIREGNELTKEWLTTAFRFRGYLKPDGEVTSVQLRPLSEGLGAFGELIKVTLELEGAQPGAPTQFVAKFAPQGSTPIPRFLVRQTFMSETHFYNDFSVEQGGLPRPECYFAAADPKQRKLTFCLLIEDMAPALTISRTAGCALLPQLQSVMAALARLHARWWGHPRGPPLDWAPHPKDYGGAVGTVWRFLERAGLRALPQCFGEEYWQVLQWAPAVRSRQKQIFRRLFAEPLTLCHGDAHLDNIFFHERFPDGCALVDFGNLMFGQALSDVAFFLATNVSVETRREHEHDLLRFYHAKLIEGGVDPVAFPYERCLRDYRFQLWRPFVALLTIAPGFAKQKKLGGGMFAPSPTETDRRLLAMYTQFNQRLATALVDHNWLELLLEGERGS